MVGAVLVSKASRQDPDGSGERDWVRGTDSEHMVFVKILRGAEPAQLQKNQDTHIKKQAKEG